MTLASNGKFIKILGSSGKLTSFPEDFLLSRLILKCDRYFMATSLHDGLSPTVTYLFFFTTMLGPYVHLL